MRPTAALLLIFAIAACGEAPPASGPGPAAGPSEIPVADGAGRLVLHPDGNRLLVMGIEENALSIVDLRAGKETARIPIPHDERMGEYVRGYALDPDGRTVWAPTTHGRVLRLDLAGKSCEQIFHDPEYFFTGAVRDEVRDRLVLSGENEENDLPGFFALAAGELALLRETPRTPDDPRRVGDVVRYHDASLAIWGDGRNDSALGTFDLESGELTAYRELPEGIAHFLAIGPAGDTWVVDCGKERFFRFGPDWECLSERRMCSLWGEDAGEGIFPMCMAVDADRVVVADGGEQATRIVEYARKGNLLGDLPAREFQLSKPGSITDLICLPDGRLAVAVYSPGRIVLLGPRDARPFTGW